MMTAPRRCAGVLVLALAACEPRDGGDARDGGEARDDVTQDSAADTLRAVADQVDIERDTLPGMPPPPPTDVMNPGRVRDTLPRAMPGDLAVLDATLVIPVQGVRAAELRDTFTESRGDGRVHDAIDILAPRGTPVLSVTGGRLLRMFNSRPGGLMVYATDASERFILLYGHLDRYADGLRDGMRLERGQVIGYVGTTGNAPPDTPHLHFGILRGDPSVSWSKGTAVNPYPLLVRAESR
jgi:murein DD-endopeptidase MepM/ murein hydrolase activator NlpD